MDGAEMKWIVLAVGAVVLYLIFRRINREQSSVSYPADLVQSNPATMSAPAEFAGRASMTFDEFYNRYYAAENIDRSFVHKILEYVSKSGGVPAELLRPEDRLDSLPKKTTYRGMLFVQKIIATGVRPMAQQQGIALPEIRLETLDDLIRQLEPHHIELFKQELQGHSGMPS
jgi:hypothetical protein